MTLIPYRCLARILPPIHLVALACWAQTNVGRISGSVEDTTGASIPHCAVIVTNPATGFRQTSSTDSSGLFVFPSLLPGTYKPRVEHKGFKRIEQNARFLDAASSRDISITMEVGQVSESVQVSATADQVQTTSGNEIGRAHV